MRFKKVILFSLILSFVSVITAIKGGNEPKKVISYSYGSVGEAVFLIQKRLQEYGYYSGETDGIYGVKTYEAVRLFQQNNGLYPDGIAGEGTISALGITNSVRYANDIDVIARAIYAEGRGEPYEGQVAIGAVIINRVESPDFPDTVEEVVYQTGAFDAVRDGQINLLPNESAYLAAQDAKNGFDPTGEALYYWNPATATSRWIWSVPVTYSIGNHVFGKK